MRRTFRRSTKGAVLVEFALSALLIVLVLIGTVEFGLSIHTRQSLDRLADKAADVYAFSHDTASIDALVAEGGYGFVAMCLEAPRVVVFDSIVGIDPLRDTGRPAAADPADEDGVAFRVEMRCNGNRITPILSGMLGIGAGHTAAAFARFQEVPGV